MPCGTSPPAGRLACRTGPVLAFYRLQAWKKDKSLRAPKGCPISALFSSPSAPAPPVCAEARRVSVPAPHVGALLSNHKGSGLQDCHLRRPLTHLSQQTPHSIPAPAPQIAGSCPRSNADLCSAPGAKLRANIWPTGAAGSDAEKSDAPIRPRTLGRCSRASRFWTCRKK
jgi:hypothetical protein